MSETRIEWTGNIQVHHPVKQEAEVIELPEPDELGYNARWLPRRAA